jgi:RND family efflux transporter MFP subunit
MMRINAGLLLAALAVTACGKDETPVRPALPTVTGPAVAVIDTVGPEYFEASGTAEPVERATLSTRLMATVLMVVPLEGTRVRKGDVLVRLDASDLDARRKQAAAGIAEAAAMHDLAAVTAGRMRSLYADSAAPKAQLDAAEAGLARAASGLSAARATAAELEATAAYAEIRAPFDGIVTRRFVDPGAFAAPGAPLLTVEASDRLRISATVPAAMARGLAQGKHVAARLEGEVVDAVIEGVVPAGGNLYTVNAILANGAGRQLAGSSATLLVVTGQRHLMLVPSDALVRQGDLVGVRRRMGGSAELTWLRIGGTVGDRTEVLSGLAVGDSVLRVGPADGLR